MTTMTILNRRESPVLFLGDIIAFSLALWVTLFVRSWAFPSMILLQSFILPFSILFIVWVLVFFIAGLYEKHTNLIKGRIPSIILNAHITNIILAFLFFYFVPIFGIAPKTTLVIYLFVSFGFILAWRLYVVNFFMSQRKDMAILVGSGEEMKELYDEVNKNNRYSLNFTSFIDVDDIENFDFQKQIVDQILFHDIETIVIDVRHKMVEPILSNFYNLIFSRINFLEMSKVYEDVFDRIPLSTLKDGWFIENISTSPKFVYDFLKRLMDIIVGILLGVISLAVYPFVWILIKFDDGGPLFFTQKRVGKDDSEIEIAKIRTMSVKENVDFENDSKSRVTKIGNFLRKSRIDEIPQIWSIIKGDQSLIGPRPELPALVRKYEEHISYYKVRHLIKPGLSGWAQIYHDNHPHHGIDVEQTKEKLSYDLYYVKNRSFMLDLKIALRTIAQLISRKGK